MVHAITSTRRRPPLEAAELPERHRLIQELHHASVHRGEELEIELRAINGARLVFDASLAKCLRRPFAGVAVAYDSFDAVALQKHGRLADDGQRLERSLP